VSAILIWLSIQTVFNDAAALNLAGSLDDYNHNCIYNVRNWVMVPPPPPSSLEPSTAGVKGDSSSGGARVPILNLNTEPAKVSAKHILQNKYINVAALFSALRDSVCFFSSKTPKLQAERFYSAGIQRSCQRAPL